MEAVRAKVIVNDNPAMRGFVRGTRCDAKGTFVSKNCPPAPISSSLRWTTPRGRR